MGTASGEVQKLSNGELAREFVGSEGTNTEAGAEIMKRVLERAGLEPTWLQKPLVGRGGEPVTKSDGRSVTVEGYLNDVAVNHPAAIGGVLRFLTADVTTPDFIDQQQAIADMVKSHT